MHKRANGLLHSIDFYGPVILYFKLKGNEENPKKFFNYCEMRLTKKNRFFMAQADSNRKRIKPQIFMTVISLALKADQRFPQIIKKLVFPDWQDIQTAALSYKNVVYFFFSKSKTLTCNKKKKKEMIRNWLEKAKIFHKNVFLWIWNGLSRNGNRFLLQIIKHSLVQCLRTMTLKPLQFLIWPPISILFHRFCSVNDVKKSQNHKNTRQNPLAFSTWIVKQVTIFHQM